MKKKQESIQNKKQNKIKSMNRLKFQHVKMTLFQRKREYAFLSSAYRTFYKILSNNLATKKNLVDV